MVKVFAHNFMDMSSISNYFVHLHEFYIASGHLKFHFTVFVFAIYLLYNNSMNDFWSKWKW